MAKHRRQSATIARRLTAASVAAAGLGLMAPGAATATEVVIPNTDFRASVPGIENVQGIQNIPNVEQYIPSLNSSAPAQAAAAAGLPAPAPAANQTAGQKIVDAARSKIGAPYAWGAAGPASFDCSGLTTWAYAQAGKSIPRTSQAQASAGQNVPLNALQPGDIIVYYSGASHVGIYTGNGTIIDALNSGSPVGERPLNFQPIHSAVRF